MSAWVTCPTVFIWAWPPPIPPVDTGFCLAYRPLVAERGRIAHGPRPCKPGQGPGAESFLLNLGGMVAPPQALFPGTWPLLGKRPIIARKSLEEHRPCSISPTRLYWSPARRGATARAIAQEFAAAGARVAVHYRSNRAAAEATLAGLPGGPHLLVAGDVADAAAVAAMVEAVVAEAGRIDILVNNAAIYEDHPLAEVDYETWQASWQRVIDTNVLGAANASYCAARHMIRQGGGRIVNVSSRGAFRGEPVGPAYGASKAALNAMSQSLAKYLAPYGVSVDVVAPGFVPTDLTATMPADLVKQTLAYIPLGRWGEAQEVAHAVAFLASDRAAYITGEVLRVDGGIGT